MDSFIDNAVKSTLNNRQLRFLPRLRSLSQLAFQDVRYNLLGQVFPIKPTKLELLIHGNRNEEEVSLDELQRILNDKLFSKLKYVVIKGNELILRGKFLDLFKSICSKKPHISGVQVITSVIDKDIAKQEILSCADICKLYGVDFSVVVSLGGLEDAYGTVKGQKYNLNSDLSLLNYLRIQTDIPTFFECKITASNALYVDELLEYAKVEGLYGRFLVPEYTDFLRNSEQTEFIRPFDNKLSYHLGLFFYRLENDFEKGLSRKKIYRSIRSMIAEGKPREKGSLHQTHVVALNSSSSLIYCSPKFPDYHEPVTFREKLSSFFQERKYRRKYDCIALLQQSSKLAKEKRSDIDLLSLNSKKVLIVGWYGTETAGDKAILWTVINRLRSRHNPPEQIYLSSLWNSFISQWTVKEMDLGNISIVETYSKEFEKVCDEADEIVVGGGPLMHIEPLNHILYAFIRAARSKSLARVEGCGIGPLTSPLYTQVVSEILRLSDHITLRDSSSTNRCLRDFSVIHAETTQDPATDYVQSILARPELLRDITPPLGHAKNISCFLREWDRDFARHLDELEYMSIKLEFEIQLAQLVVFVVQSRGLDVHLLPMHSFHIGGDDRVFNRRLARSISNLHEENGLDSAIRSAKGPISPLEILQSMYNASFNVCMRFHSVLFAETLGVPYVAIDYTGGGKIKAFLQDRGKLDKLITLRDVAAGAWKDNLANLLQSH